MRAMRQWLCVTSLVCSACIAPRSMIQAQMASNPGRGAMDVSVFTGVQFAEQTNPQFERDNAVTGEREYTEEKTTAFGLPGFEANLQYGFSENVALNVHGSTAGFQPGLKITVNDYRDDAHFALLPQIAFGYGSTGWQTDVIDSGSSRTAGVPTTNTSFTFLGGLKLLVSHKSGFYAGAGYDFLFNRHFNKTRSGDGNSSVEIDTTFSTVAHQISVNLGFDIKLGFVHLRPEIAVALYPGIGQNRTVQVGGSASNSADANGGFGWALFPGFSIGVQSPRRELTQAEEDEEAEKKKVEKKKKRHRRNTGRQVEEDDDDDDDSDDDDRPKQRRSSDADEDGVRRRKPADEWE